MAGDRGLRYPELTANSLQSNLNLPKNCSGAQLSWASVTVVVLLAMPCHSFSHVYPVSPVTYG
jgi:hypothetical protein